MIQHRDAATSRLHLVPFFGNLGLSEITAGKIQEYRIHRHPEAMAKRGKPPARSTMHQEIVILRQTLKTAVRYGWLERLPDLSEPYRSSPKISHRAWFSPEESKQLYEARRKRAHELKQEPTDVDRSSRTIMCGLGSIPACGLTRPGGFNSVT
jgi:hypothetical protein